MRNLTFGASMRTWTRACRENSGIHRRRRARDRVSEQLRSLFKEALANDKVPVQCRHSKGESALRPLILCPSRCAASTTWSRWSKTVAGPARPSRLLIQTAGTRR